MGPHISTVLSCVLTVAHQEKALRYQLHRSPGKHSTALRGLSRPEAVCPEAAEEWSQPLLKEQER